MTHIYEYKKANSKWYYVKIFMAGKQIIKRGFKTKKEAQNYIALQYTLANKNDKKISNLSELNDVFIQYLYEKYMESSAYRYSKIFNRYINPYFNKYKIDKINSFTIDDFNKYVNKLPLKSKKDILFITKVYLSFLKKYGLDATISDKSLYVFKQPFSEPKSYDYYTMDEFQTFIKVVDDPMFYLVFIMLFYYGLRIGELRGLKHSDIVGNKVFIRRCITNKNGRHKQVITSVKTASSNRDYPLLESIKTAYQRYINSLDYVINKDDFIFLSRKCKKRQKVIGETTIKRAQVFYCNKANLRVIKLHEFRHSCATYLFNKGAEIELISSWLGRKRQKFPE